ncbi:MAG TPA: methyltransferase, partial [Nitrospiria bacterium]|nr:methyltransferase [Nitrospiria bacterium]
MPDGKPSSPIKVRLVEEKSVVPEGMEETLKQPLKGYRFSEDTLYLVNAIRPAPSENILEIGTGCGIISLCLAKQYPTIKITAIEIDEELSACAGENAALCGLENQIQIIQGDVQV